MSNFGHVRISLSIKCYVATAFSFLRRKWHTVTHFGRERLTRERARERVDPKKFNIFLFFLPFYILEKRKTANNCVSFRQTFENSRNVWTKMKWHLNPNFRSQQTTWLRRPETKKNEDHGLRPRELINAFRNIKILFIALMASKMGIKKFIYECFVCSVQILL